MAIESGEEFPWSVNGLDSPLAKILWSRPDSYTPGWHHLDLGAETNVFDTNLFETNGFPSAPTGYSSAVVILVISNRAPPSVPAVTVTSQPWAVATCLTMARPKPVPLSDVV